MGVSSRVGLDELRKDVLKLSPSFPPSSARCSSLELLTLSWLLFGGWRGVPRGGRWHGGHRGRWEALTPEERERLARGRNWCGPREAAPAEARQAPAS